MVTKTRDSNKQPITADDETNDPADCHGDIIEDILRVCLAMAPGFTDALRRQIDAEVRARWAGDRPYIAGRAGEGRSARNDAIVKGYIAGEQINFLARRHGVTPRRILQIIKGK